MNDHQRNTFIAIEFISVLAMVLIVMLIFSKIGEAAGILENFLRNDWRWWRDALAWAGP